MRACGVMRLHSKLRSYQLYGGSAPGSSQSGQPTGGAVGAHRADDQPRKFGTPNSGLEDDGVGVHTVVPRCVALSCVARCGAMRQLGGISPRPVVARHKPLFDRSSPVVKTIGMLKVAALAGNAEGLAAGRRHRVTNKLQRHCRKPVVLAERPSVFDRHVLALDKTVFAEPPAKRRDQMGGFIW